MSSEYEWLLATIRKDSGETSARFAHQHRSVIDQPAYSRTLWFEIEAIDTTDIDEYLRDLDDLEDLARSQIEGEMKSLLVLVLTGAGYRDLVFAVREDDSRVEDTVRSLVAQKPDRINSKWYAGQHFGPYRALVSRVGGPI